MVNWILVELENDIFCFWVIFFSISPNENQLGFHMRYHLFLHYVHDCTRSLRTLSPFKSNIYYYFLGLPNVRIDWYDFIFLMVSRGSFSQASFHFDEKIFFHQWYNIYAKVPFIYYVSTCIAQNLI